MTEEELKVIAELHALRRRLPALPQPGGELHTSLRELIVDTEEKLEIVFERFFFSRPPPPGEQAPAQ